MASSYSSWSLEKLKKEATKIEKAIKARESTQKKVVVAEIKAVAKKHGFALSELLAEASTATAKRPGRPPTNGKKNTSSATANTRPAKKRAKAKIKYRNPVNRSETWTGRGRQPRWITAYLGSGGKMDELSI